MNLFKLQCFATVAQSRSFTQAAEKLFISQPSLSRNIAFLEKELGFKLFDRTKPMLTLTQRGEAVLEETKEILNQWNHLERRINHIRMGYSYQRLRIGYWDIVDYELIAESIGSAMKRFQDLGVIPVKKNFGSLLQDLRSGDLDLVFAANVDSSTLTDLCYIKVGGSELALVVNDQHPLAGRKSVRLKDLEHEKMIKLTREESPETTDYIVGLCNKSGFSPNIVFSPFDLDSSLLMVSAGLGVSIISPRMQQKVPLQNLRYIEIEDEGAKMSVDLLWLKDNTNPLIKPYVEICKELIEHRNTDFQLF